MRILFFLVFILLSAALSAQKFYNIGVEDGLSSHQAYDVVEDNNGFIWISTKVGIDRFDGENILSYDNPGGNGANSSQRIKLRIDKSKKLYACSESGQIYLFDEGKNSFERLFSLTDSINTNIILIDYAIDENYNWFCTQNGLWVFDCENKRIREIAFFKGKRITKICKYYKNKYLIAASGDLFEIDIQDWLIKPVVEFELKKNSNDIRSIYWNEVMSEIWVGTQSGDIFVYNSLSKSYINLKHTIHELPGVPVFKITATSKNEILLGSDGGGIFKIDGLSKELISNYRENVDNASSLVGNGIRDLIVTKSGDLYVTTFTGGLNILTNIKNSFKIIRHEIKNTNSLRNNVVSNILEDFEGDLWFATNNGVSCWQKEKNKWIHFLDNNTQFANVFLALCQYDQTTVIAGSYGKGIYLLSKKDGIIKHIFPGRQASIFSEKSDHVVELFMDNRNRIWAGDTFKEMSVLDLKKQSITYIPLNAVKSIQPKDNDNLFVANSEGIYIVNTESFAIQKIKLDGLPENIFVNSLNFDYKNKILWVATSGQGLLKINLNSNEIEKLDIGKGLPSNHVYAVLRYEENIIWVSSEKGLSRYNIKDGNIENFSIKDGLSDDSFYRNSKCKTNSGDFYFGSYQGATYFNPDNIKVAEENAMIYLDEFLISNQAIYSNDNKSPLKEPLNQTKELVLKYKESSFSIGFTSIIPVNSGKIKYSWKLEGQDENWTIPSFNKQANYTNVSKGNFQFRLKALSDRTGDVLDERLINIAVKPPPWNTLWARILYVLFLIIIVGLVYRYLRISDMKKLSDAKIQFFTNTAHDIKTPLTLALAPLGDLQKSKNLNENERYLLELSFSNISNLSNSVNHLLDFQKSDMGKNQLVLSKENIIKLINDRYNYFNQIAERKNIRFECVIEPENLVEWIDSSKIEK